jgi:hypothetical protein
VFGFQFLDSSLQRICGSVLKQSDKVVLEIESSNLVKSGEHKKVAKRGFKVWLVRKTHQVNSQLHLLAAIHHFPFVAFVRVAWRVGGGEKIRSERLGTRGSFCCLCYLQTALCGSIGFNGAGIFPIAFAHN